MVQSEVKTARELLALALAFEDRAAHRFRLMAARMREEARDDLARLFESLAQEEVRHADELRRMPEAADSSAEALGQDLAPDLEAICSAPDADTLRRQTLYDCLADAVRNEIKTFDFYSYVAATAEDTLLQDLAESLAKEELGHANELRRLRRQAYRQLRSEAGPWPKASAIETLGDLQAAATRGERAVAAVMGGLYRQIPELEDVTRSLTDSLPQFVAEGGESAAATSDTDTGPAARGASDGRARPDRDRLRAALRCATEAFEFYDAVVSMAAREDVMLTAQALSACALRRIQLLRGSQT